MNLQEMYDEIYIIRYGLTYGDDDRLLNQLHSSSLEMGVSPSNFADTWSLASHLLKLLKKQGIRDHSDNLYGENI